MNMYFLPNALKAPIELCPSCVQRRLKQQQRQTDREYEHEVHEQERTSAVFRRQIRETPHAAQADCGSGGSQARMPAYLTKTHVRE